MTKPPTVPPIVNNAVRLMLSSPLHGLIDNKTMLITFTGRKSGRTFTTPVGYSQQGNLVYVFTHNTWWKNLEGTAPVTLCLRGRVLQGLAEPVVQDKQAVATGLMMHLRKVPSDAGYYEVTFDEKGNPRAEQVEQAAQTVVMIRIQLC